MSVQVKGSGTIGGLDEGLVVSGIITSSTQLNVGSNIKLGSAGIVTASNFKTGVTNLHSTGLTLTGGQLDVGSNIKIGTAGVVTATTFSGALTGTIQTAAQPNITSLGTLSSTTINGNLTLSDSIIHTGDTNTKIQFPSNDTISFTTNALEKLRIDSDGRLLSGATSSSSSVRGVFRGFAGDGGAGQGIIHLEVNKTTTNCGNGENLGSIRFGSNEGHIGALIGAQSESAWSGSSDLPSYINFYTCPDGSGSLAERLRIHSNGAVSIANTRNYYGALNVEKTAASSTAIDIKASGAGSYASAIAFGDHNTVSGKIAVKNSTDIFFGTTSNHALILYGNSVRGLKVSNSNGRLERNFGAGSGHTADGMWFNNDTTATGYYIRFWQTSGGYGANQVGSITHTANNTQYNTSSDYRLKENAIAISDGISRLKSLKPYRFNFKTEPSKTVDGFFAHEAATVVPEAVTGTKDEVSDSDSPDIGQKAGDPVYQGIDQSKLVPLLTAALQEAIARIEALEGS